MPPRLTDWSKGTTRNTVKIGQNRVAFGRRQEKSAVFGGKIRLPQDRGCSSSF